MKRTPAKVGNATRVLGALAAAVLPACVQAVENSMTNEHVRYHRFEVSNYRPIAMCDPSFLQDGRLKLPQCFNIVRFGDVNNDGALEMIGFKGAGEQYACDLSGKRLWYYRDEKADGRPARVDSKWPVCDLDGDGKLELVCVRMLDGKPHYCMLDAGTGEVKRRCPMLPSPCEAHLSVIPAWLDGRDKPPGLVVNRDYWRLEVYGPDLKLRWQHDIPELGHTTIARDLDGDGRDELWVGTRLFAADGRAIWSKPELLQGTGEVHPDSIRIVDLNGDGKLDLLFGPGAIVLDAKGQVQWQLGKDLGLTEVQSIRLLRTDKGYRICFTDLPYTGEYYTSGGQKDYQLWRGFKLRDVRNKSVLTDNRGKVLARFEGLHTPEAGDWDGDGNEEVFNLARDGETMEIRGLDGELRDSFRIQSRLYISDMLVLPVLKGAKGSQFIYHEWNEDFTRTECVIIENLKAKDAGRAFDQWEMAVKTTY